MATFLLHLLILSVFSGVTGRTDLLRPPRVTLAAEAPMPAPTPALKREEPVGPRKLDPASLGVKLTAPSAALIDTKSGEVLFSQGDDRIVPIASITKLMTSMVILDLKPEWGKQVTIESGDNALAGIQYLHVGDRLRADEVFDVMLVGSANNAAMALSRSLGISRAAFVARMNSKARELGLFHTTFTDPTGYAPENVSTSLDVARLAFAALERPEIREALTRTELVVRTAAGADRRVPATNELLQSFLNEGEFAIVGGKTGYTEEAGYTLVLRARKGAADVIAVTLGSATSEDRFQDAKSLLFWGFKTFAW
ncbi:MAG TPA: serine hydrolase [Candidatus Baltobacteraceae bacterium]|nr:serine hydrolase [Candidatus Baltobacteraceae bacterium]